MKRWLIAAIVAVIAFILPVEARPLHGNGISSTPFLNAGWNPLLIGAGGALRAVDIQCDQGVGQCAGTGTTTKIVRPDTFGAYVWITSGSCATSVVAPCWKNILSTNTMSAGEMTSITPSAAYEIVSAPSNTNQLYMIYNGLFFASSNKGTSWGAHSAALAQQVAGVNEQYSATGKFMAVSPGSSSAVYFSIPLVGVFFTLNGGTTITQISTSTIPAGNHTGCGGGPCGQGNLVWFDLSDATGNTLFIAVYGSGVYRCTAALSSPSCNNVNFTGVPTTNRHMAIAPNGVVWVTDDSSGNVHSYSGGASGTWTSWTAAGNGFWSVAIDPANSSHVIVGDEGGNINVTNNAGTTWLGLQSNTSSNRTATDIPWLAQTNETFMTNGDMQFDMAQSSQLIFAEGIGVWTAPGPTTAVLPQWISMSKGIEQLVAIQVLSPPGCNAAITGSWDRPVFYNNNANTYPSVVKPSYNTQSIIGGWGLAYASSNPSFIVSMMDSNIATQDESGFSSDCGQTWTQMSPMPLTLSGASIAASTTTDWMLCYTDNGNCYWTVNGGAAPTWNIIDNSVIPNLHVLNLLTANAPTAAGNCVLHFPNVPSNIIVGDVVFDRTNPAAINGSGSQTATVASVVTGTNGTVTINATCATGSGVATNDVVQIAPTAAIGTGWGFANFFSRQIAAADRVTPDVFYLYNYLTSPNLAGIYICTINHSVPSISCVQGEAGSLGNNDDASTKLVTMPGVAGEMFFTADATSTSAMQKCTTAGSTITCAAVSSGGHNFTSVNAIGFGKVFSTFASIVIYGTLNGVQGLYDSKDNASTWTLIDSTIPLGNPAAIGDISCDQNTPMNCYVALGSGSGWAYYGGIN